MKGKQLNLAVVFGGKSSEHEVSIVTAFQVWSWINQQKFKCYLIYLDQQNNSFLCPLLQGDEPQKFIKKVLRQKINVNFVKGGIEFKQGLLKKHVDLGAALLLTHGGSGENGELQGLLDFFDIPYTGSDVLGSGLSMDKVLTKDLLVRCGFRVAPYLSFYGYEFKNKPKVIISRIEKKIKYPVFIKPARGGSSIGISKVDNKNELTKAINLALLYDFKILVEKSIEGAVDINCAALGGNRLIVSVCEQPISEDKFLSFKEKYLKGGKSKGMAGLARIIPAPIPEKISEEIRQMTQIIFPRIVGWGMARVDFLYQKKTGKIYPNEINTIPGSLAFYLWEASGIKRSELVEKMIILAKERKRATNKLKFSFESEILSQK